ncbi:hypothetical protein K435DRAFT_863266 [Dendrothele bispora CBS 962.96]|uniref:Retrotransposon gag domain-containing protein n=1 Tax=Dendrothele bispora (strain CBS 962.96) TaxID=1314807 RepID=A0A4S8LQY8_DENBC|nr:hypothetical protein K435DRAFT_863266 [Dendrothele bispora CBS 962.96]
MSSGNPNWATELNNLFDPSTMIATLTVQDVNIIQSTLDCLDCQQSETNTALNSTAASASAPPPPVPPVIPSEPATFVSTEPPLFTAPSTFKGKASEIEEFIQAVEDAVDLRLTSLHTDGQKCLYMSTLLGDGAPKQWYCSIRLNKSSLLGSFTEFTDSAAAYASRFLELLVHVNWTDETKIDNFYRNLKPSVKDLISNTKWESCPKTFLDYAVFAIDCDNRVHKQELEPKDESSKKSTNNNTLSSSKSESTLPPGEPMQIDATISKPRGKLTEAEWKHCIDNDLGLYCGKCRKTTDTCPNHPPHVIKCVEEKKDAA